jgi:hypothetical protein
MKPKNGPRWSSSLAPSRIDPQHPERVTFRRRASLPAATGAPRLEERLKFRRPGRLLFSALIFGRIQ